MLSNENSLGGYGEIFLAYVLDTRELINYLLKKRCLLSYTTIKIMSNLTEQMSALRTYMDTAEKELASLHAGKKASSARARKALGQIKTLCHLMRKGVIEHVRTMPVKSKSKKVVAEVVGPVEQPEEAVEAPMKKKRVRKTP